MQFPLLAFCPLEPDVRMLGRPIDDAPSVLQSLALGHPPMTQGAL
jgi:hypothetical protein